MTVPPPSAESADLLHRLDAMAEDDDYGPQEYQRLARLAATTIREQSAKLAKMLREINECEQIAGKALGYPWYKDDPKNFPGATEVDGVCVGDHFGASIVAELAAKLGETGGGDSDPEQNARISRRS